MTSSTESIVCANCGTPNPVGARFCNACGSRLEAPAPARETRRTVTIMFVDVAGSTALGERLDPETLRALIGRFFELARSVVERHGGVVEKFIGDAVMAVFGVPTLHEDDALRAVRAAAELQARFRETGLAEQLTTRTGVNTGPVVTGEAEDNQRLVTGDAVNVAARLEQAAQPAEILIGAETYRLVRDAIVVDELDPIAAKGKAEPVRAFRLVAVDPAGEATIRHLDAPLIGRDRELTRMVRSFEDAVAERRPGLFTLLGPAGVGKSRLVFELARRVGDRATILRGRCLPYGEGITYWPIAEVVRAAAGVDETDDRATALAKLRAIVASEPDGIEIADRVAAAVGLVEGETDREDLFRSVRRFLETLAARLPVLIVLDDLQWAESTFLDLVEHVVDWSSGVAFLVVVLARPELLDHRPGWSGGKLNSQTVLLEGLGVAEIRALAASLLGADVDPTLLARIEEVAEGNPLFVEQLVAMLVEDGHLTRDGEAWRPSGDLRAIHVPPTISALLAARLDRLPSDERQLAERASVVGRVFERIAVAELSPEAQRPDVTAHLRSLVRRELIRPDPSAAVPEDTFRFRHILIRDAAYEALPKRDRADLHARFADWLEATTGGRLAEFEEIVGHHLDQAVRYRDELGIDDERTADLRRRAAGRLIRGGERAMERTDPLAAIRLLSRGVELGGAAGMDVLDATIDLGIANLDASRFAACEAVLDQARLEAEARGDELRARRAGIIASICRNTHGATITGHDLDAEAIAAIRVFERHRDDRALVDGWAARGAAALTHSRWAEATAAYRQALVYAERASAVGMSELVRAWLSNALVWGPTPAEEGIAGCRELRRESRSRRVAATTMRHEATLLGYAGRTDEAWALLAEARAALDDLGIRREVAGLGLGAGEIARSNGDDERAIAELTAGRAILTEAGDTAVRSTVEGMLGICLAAVGRDDEAIELSRSSERLAAGDDMASQCTWRAGRALAFAHTGLLDEAVVLAAEAVELGQHTDQINALAEMFEAQAEVLRIAGRSIEADAALASAIESYERKGNVASVARLQREEPARRP